MAFVDAAYATTIYVTSVGYSAVQTIINGAIVRSIQIGEVTPEGVKLQSIEGSNAIFEVDGRLVRLGIGQSVSPDISIRMASDGAFRLIAHLNGQPLRAMIDTGASFVALSSATARQLGIDYLKGQRGLAHTANGSVTAYRVIIPRIQVGEIVVLNVIGAVSEGTTISKDTDVLLGNSFLQHVEMQRSRDTMVIKRLNTF
jgi:aspartyl protease family protein